MSTGGVKLGSSYDEARTRKVNAEAEIAELELAKLRGELVVAEDVVSAWENVLGAAKAKFLSIPTKAAPIVAAELDAGACQKVIEDLVNEALEEFSNYEPKVSATEVSGKSSEEGDGDAKAAPKTKRKRVGRPRKTTRLAK
jgi:hypothetical protein